METELQLCDDFNSKIGPINYCSTFLSLKSEHKNHVFNPTISAVVRSYWSLAVAGSHCSGLENGGATAKPSAW